MHSRSGSPRLGGLILAAGASSRMGAFKPLLPLRGRTVIENAVDSLRQGGAASVTVVLGHRRGEVEALLRSRYPAESLTLACNREYAASDMLASIKIGLRAMPACEAFFLLPGDMPLVGRETLSRLRQALPEGRAAIVFPTVDGYPKHPPLIHSGFIPGILSYQGEKGLRGFWEHQREKIVTVPVEDAGCQVDLDTFSQYTRCLEQYQE